MSYATVELEIDRLVCALKSDTESNLEEVQETVRDLFAAMQTGMEFHIEECQGIVDALARAREGFE